DYNLHSTSSVRLDKCLKVIRDYAWRCTNEPLFIAFEMNISSGDIKTLNNMKSMIQKYLGNRLLLPSSNKLLKNYTITELTGKVILLSTSHRNQLDELIYTNLYGGGQFI